MLHLTIQFAFKSVKIFKDKKKPYLYARMTKIIKDGEFRYFSFCCNDTQLNKVFTAFNVGYKTVDEKSVNDLSAF